MPIHILGNKYIQETKLSRRTDWSEEEFERTVTDFLQAYSQHVSEIVLTGFTPYFNDGDELTYRVDDMSVRLHGSVTDAWEDINGNALSMPLDLNGAEYVFENQPFLIKPDIYSPYMTGELYDIVTKNANHRFSTFITPNHWRGAPLDDTKYYTFTNTLVATNMTVLPDTLREDFDSFREDMWHGVMNQVCFDLFGDHAMVSIRLNPVGGLTARIEEYSGHD